MFHKYIINGTLQWNIIEVYNKNFIQITHQIIPYILFL
jgi:hypothetical protein